MSSIWVKSAELRDLLRLSRQAVLKITHSSNEGKSWRGCKVEVRKVEGVVGHGGISYEFLITSLPADVQQKYWVAQKIDIPTEQLVGQIKEEVINEETFAKASKFLLRRQ